MNNEVRLQARLEGINYCSHFFPDGLYRVANPRQLGINPTNRHGASHTAPLVFLDACREPGVHVAGLRIVQCEGCVGGRAASGGVTVAV